VSVPFGNGGKKGLIDASMADLGFGQDFGMQDGTGDSWYMDYIHDFMRFSAVRRSQPGLQLIYFLTTVDCWLPSECLRTRRLRA
jgi:hypothetical protein